MHVLVEPSSLVLFVTPIVATGGGDDDSSTPHIGEREQPSVFANRCEVPPVGEVEQAIDPSELFFRHLVDAPAIGASSHPTLWRPLMLCSIGLASGPS